MRDFGATRNSADMLVAGLRGLAPGLAEELRTRARNGEWHYSETLLAYLGRFPHARQREVFKGLVSMGVRRAKRLVENQIRPPSQETVASSVAAFLDREFPGVEADTLREALNDVYCALQEETFSTTR
jgi:hypothetical protein